MLEGSGGSRFYGGSICLRASGGSILWKPHVPEGAGGFDLKRPHLLEGGQVFDFKEAPFTCRALRWHKVEAFLAEAIPPGYINVRYQNISCHQKWYHLGYINAGFIP